MSDVSDLETYGRLSLWLSAVSECKTLLNLSKKSSESAIEISKRYNGSVELHHGFPSFIECMQMANYNKMLAVIFFSQPLILAMKTVVLLQKILEGLSKFTLKI